MPRTKQISQSTLYLLAAETGFIPRTIARWASGEGVRASTARTLERACDTLKIARPKGAR